MELREDVTVPEMGDFRWLTVGPVGQPDIAARPDGRFRGRPCSRPRRRHRSRTWSRRAPPAACSSRPTTARRRTRSSGAGVEFTQEPTEQPYGIDAGFRDPSGNQIRVMQAAVERSVSREGSAEGGALPGVQSTESRSTTNTSGSCGAITPPAPRAPYAIADGIVSCRRPPTLMPCTPASQPGITWPLPSLNVNGCATIPRGVELLAGRERDARVVTGDRARPLRRPQSPSPTTMSSIRRGSNWDVAFRP